MTDTVTFARIESGGEAPAVWHPGWLPDVDLFPDLAELVDERKRLEAQRDVTGKALRQASAALAAHEAQREHDLRAAFAAEEPDKEIPDEREQLAAAVADAQLRSNAAVGALIDQTNRCIATVVEKRHQWIGILEERERAADQEDRELVARLLELRSSRADFGALEYWIERTGGPVRPMTADRPPITVSGAELPQAHFPYASVGRPLSTDLAVAERERRAIFIETYRTDRDIIIDEDAEQSLSIMAAPTGEVSDAEIKRAEHQLRGALAGQPGALV
jgi:hypothetical protein